MPFRTPFILAAVAGTVALAACGSSSPSSSSVTSGSTVGGVTSGSTVTTVAKAGGAAPTVAARASGPATTAGSAAVATTAAGAATTPAGATKKVNANTATQAEIVAVLTANGVPSADRWAREITEYRPYPADDANWSTLRNNLAKYNPDPAVLEKIIASLSA